MNVIKLLITCSMTFASILSFEVAGNEQGVPSLPPGWTNYSDSAFEFRIGIPKDFVIRKQSPEKIADFIPTPLASIFFMNPTMAAGALAEIEPPDLQFRIYRAKSVDSLRSWLHSMHFLSKDDGDFTAAYRNAGLEGLSEGLKVCRATMIAPGCAVYILYNDRVFQLTPISREGEAMIETFKPML